MNLLFRKPCIYTLIVMVFITMISIIPTEMITVNGSSFSQPDKVPIGIDVIKEANMTSCYPGDTINFSYLC
jgi:hypothetical protein